MKIGISLIKAQPVYSGEIKKRSFIPTVWPPVHTNPLREWRMAFRFRAHIKHFENSGGGFLKRCGYNNHVISPTEVSSNTNPR